MVLNVAAGCTARSCIDVHDPVKVKKLKEWAESDARFLRKISMAKKDNHDQDQKSERLSFAASSSSKSNISERSESLERIVCRQIYLRSYTFDKQPEKDDSVKQKTRSSWLKLMKYWKVLEKDNNKPKSTTKKIKEGSNNCSQTLKGGIRFLLSFLLKADVRSCSGNHQYCK